MIGYDSEDIEAQAWKLTALYWCQAYHNVVTHPTEEITEDEIEAAIAQTFMAYLSDIGERLFDE